MKTARFLGLAAGPAIVATASAAPTFVISVGDNMYVRTGAAQQQFALSDNLTSMALAPNGEIIGSSPSDDGNGTYELYRVDDPTTAPSLSLVGDFLQRNTPSLTYIGSTLYGIQTPGIGGAPPSRLVTIDIGAQTETVVGQTGEFPLNSAGSGFDPATSTLYAMSKGVNGELYDLDYTVVPPNDPTATFIGQASISYVNHAGEYFGGKLYGVAQTGVPGFPTLVDVFLGEINTTTGEFTTIAQVVDNFDPSTLKDGAASIGLAVIPTPGSAAIIGLAALGFARRRR